MDIGFYIVGNIVIDYVANALNVQASSSHVSGDQYVYCAALQVIDSRLALLLRYIAIESSGRIAAGSQLLSNFSGGNSSANKNDHPVKVFDFEYASQCVQLVHPGHHPDALTNRLIGHGLHFNGDVHRVVQMLLRDAGDCSWHGGREQRYLAVIGRLLENPLHVIDEAHTQHFVRFVQYQRAQRGKVQRTSAHMIHNTTRCAYHNLNSTL